MKSADYPLFTKYDVVMLSKSNNLILSDSLSATEDYASNTIDKTGIMRPWGPGIILEMVLYVLMHMGIKDITTIGWDIAGDGGTNQHYYEQDPPPVHLSRQKNYRALAKSFVKKLGLSQPLRVILHFFRHKIARAAYERGEVCYKTRMQPGEAELVASSIPSLLAWFSSQGVEIRVISNSKWMASRLS